MNEGSIEPSRPVDSTHSGKYDKPATGRGEQEGSVGGRSHHQHCHLTQLFGCLYLTDNQGDFRGRGVGGDLGQSSSSGNTGVTSAAAAPQSNSSPRRRSSARLPHKAALCFHLRSAQALMTGSGRTLGCTETTKASPPMSPSSAVK